MKVVTVDGTTTLSYMTTKTDEDLRHDVRHQTLEHFRDIFINKEDIEMNQMESTIIATRRLIKITMIAYPQLIEEQGMDVLPRRTPELRGLTNTYFNTLTVGAG